MAKMSQYRIPAEDGRMLNLITELLLRAKEKEEGFATKPSHIETATCDGPPARDKFHLYCIA